MRYQETHPWITFTYRAEPAMLWAKLGEAYSKNQHLAGIPLPPVLAHHLSAIVLAKGALATTAIEGNTLTEDEAREVISDGKDLPPSQEYLQTEIRNIVAALDAIDTTAGAGFELTPKWLSGQNARVLTGLEVPEYVTPGEYTQDSLTVGPYRGAPPEDVAYLVERMCQWLNEAFIGPSQDENQPADMRFYCAVFGALLAHLYLAWIHPFGDGNGRTARLAEVAILLNSGLVPWIAANLLSDHYNRTRSRYYARLDAASKRGDVDGFIGYAVEGYVDMLREQIDAVKTYQTRIAWINYVHECLRSQPPGPARERRRDLVLAMPMDQAVAKRDIRHLTPGLAESYAGHEDRMVARDLNALQELGLVLHERDGYRAAADIMQAFVPGARRA